MTAGKKKLRILALIGFVIAILGHILWHHGNFLKAGMVPLLLDHYDEATLWHYFWDRYHGGLLGLFLLGLGWAIVVLAFYVKGPLTDNEDDDIDEFDELYGRRFRSGIRMKATDCRLEYWTSSGQFISDDTLADVGMRALSIAGQGTPALINLHVHGMVFNLDMPGYGLDE